MTISTLSYALLGILARSPLSGYEIARQLEGPMRFFWRAGHSQIYPELARLEVAGLVTHEVIPQRDRPAKKVYAPTPAGLEALRAWITAPTQPLAVRDELVLKAFSLWLADPAAAAAMFREQEHLHNAQLAQYEQFQAEIERHAGSALHSTASPVWGTYATLRRGLGYEREAAAWCGWIADQLEREATRGQPETPDMDP